MIGLEIREVEAVSQEENEKIVRRFVNEVVNGENPDAADELIAADYTLHVPGQAEPLRGVESVKGMASMMRGAFPDWHDEIEEMLSVDDKIVTRWHESGTHEGEFQGIAPTGKQVHLSGIDIFRIQDGKIAEAWVQMDMLGFMAQLGVGAPS